MGKYLLIIIGAIALFGYLAISRNNNSINLPTEISLSQEENQKELHPLAIEKLRSRSYEGSEITVEQTLQSGSNYERYIASYKSDGLMIRGLLTVPNGQKPEGGWPAIIFNHGYIDPDIYRTLERYVAYVDGFARNGYIVYKIDYRGHDQSEGEPASGHLGPDYTIDVLNAVASMKKYPEANPEKIGLWGHSMGGGLTLRSMVVSKDIKAGIMWAGVVGRYEDFITYRDRIPWLSPDRRGQSAGPSLDEILAQYGQPSETSEFWRSVSPYTYLEEISGPVQLHHGLADTDVPWEFSRNLNEALKEKGKKVELYTYPRGDHNLSSPAFNQAMQRSIEFYDRHLKN